MSLPRVLEPDGEGGVLMYPVEELRSLRKGLREVKPGSLTETPLLVEEIQGRVLDLEIEIDPGSAEVVGLDVLCSPGAEEFTRLEWDRKAGVLRGRYGHASEGEKGDYERFERNGGTPGLHELPFELKPEESLRLRVIVDRSVVEIFANDRQALVLRAYPTREDSDRVRLFASGGGAKVLSCRAWELQRVNPW